jgi:hypothetical protein
LGRLRWLEANHIIELDSVKRVGQEKVDNLSRRLDEVDEQRRKLHEEVTSKSEELTATAKRWVEEISTLDRGLAGKSLLFSLFYLLPASGCRLGFLLAAGSWRNLNISWLLAGGRRRLRAGCCQTFEL